MWASRPGGARPYVSLVMRLLDLGAPLCILSVPVVKSHKCSSMIPRDGAVIAEGYIDCHPVSEIEWRVTWGGKGDCRQACGGAAKRRT